MSRDCRGRLARRRAQAWGGVLALVTALVVGSSCTTSPKRCSVQCGPAGDCPNGTECMADGYCYSREEPGASCSEIVGDAGTTDGDAAVGTADAGPLAVDQPCADGDVCAAELVCADFGVGGAHCKPTCTVPEDCVGPRSRCSRTDVETADMVCSSNCDPLGSGECSAGEKCLLSRAPDSRLDANCVAHGGQAFQESCTISADCAPGLLCIGTDPNKLCEHLCAVGGTDCGAGSACNAVAGDNELGGVNYSYCQPTL